MLLAFWRLVTVTIVWHVYLRMTGRRVTLRDVRQAFVPGVFFGLNLAIFFAGATHNSVANAALIGSLSPFLIVPAGALLFHEYFNSRALVFALVAFGGVVMVLLNAPANGDASLRGNVFGFTAMLLWTGYVVSTRYFRRDMEVATFMATVSPIGAVAVLPLALANGDVLGLSSTGWTYMLILSLLTGVVRPRHARLRPAHHPDRHHRDRPGRRSRPWPWCGPSSCSVSTCSDPQVVGIAVVMTGLLGFLVLNERRGAGADRRTQCASVRS